MKAKGQNRQDLKMRKSFFVNNLPMWPFQNSSSTCWSWRDQRSKKIDDEWHPKVHPNESGFPWEAGAAKYRIHSAGCHYVWQLRESEWAAEWRWWKWWSCSTTQWWHLLSWEKLEGPMGGAIPFLRETSFPASFKWWFLKNYHFVAYRFFFF